jgi:hypothetical protein
LGKSGVGWAPTRRAGCSPTREPVGTRSDLPIGGDGLVRSIRTSLRIGDLGEFAGPIRRKLRALLPDMVAQLRIGPFSPARLEVERVAHHDGAFFARHIDTRQARTATKRVISAVYYLHSEPKAFSRGILRLYSLSPSSAPDSIHAA